MEWAGSLLAVGGHWQSAEKLTPEQEAAIESARKQTDQRMKKFALENEVFE